MTIAILIIAVNSIAQVTGTYTDSRDSTTYKTVKIGAQTWMAENLNHATSDSWCYNDSNRNCITYGRLYTWAAAKVVCPKDWHLPSDSEWTTLTTYIGGGDIVGGKLKSTSTWIGPNTGATNSSGFTALPGGYRYGNGSFGYIGSYGYWWSSTENDDVDPAWTRSLYSNKSNVFRNFYQENFGFSVRCLKDL